MESPERIQLKTARVGDRIQCEVRFPVPRTIRMRLLEPEAVAYANELLANPSSGWSLAPAGTPGGVGGGKDDEALRRAGVAGLVPDTDVGGVGATVPHPASDPDWLREKLAMSDDQNVSAGIPPKRPCDMPGGCNARNCLGCGEGTHGVPDTSKTSDGEPQ